MSYSQASLSPFPVRDALDRRHHEEATTQLSASSFSTPARGRLPHPDAAALRPLPTTARGTANDVSADSLPPRAHKVEESQDDVPAAASPATVLLDLDGFYDALRKDEQDVIRDCWYAACGIDSERVQFVTAKKHHHQQNDGGGNEHQDDTKDGNGGCGCCRRHLSLVEGRTRSAALHLLDEGRMYPLFVNNSDAVNGGFGGCYWSLLGSGAHDAIQIIGQTGAAWRDVEACRQQHLLGVGVDGMRGSTSDRKDSAGAAASGICRALASALDDELQSIRVAMAELQRVDNACGDDKTSTWTLRQFMVKLMPITSRLITLQNLCNSWRQHVKLHDSTGVGGDDPYDNDNSNKTPSGSIQLLNLILAQSRSGDPRTAELCQKLWKAAVQPWYRTLHLWITEGKVVMMTAGNDAVDVRRAQRDRRRNNNAHDFFVEVTGDESTGGGDVAPKDLWRHKFRLRPANVPTGTLTPPQVKSAFLIGKGINYFQTCLGRCLVVTDDDGAITGGSHNDDLLSLSNQPELYFSRLIQSASTKVHSHILEALRTDHTLLQHMLALKQFLLLGQGDFVTTFMEGLMEEFGSGNTSAEDRRNRRGNNNPYTMPGMHRHALNGILDASLRSSNAMKFTNDVLKRLQVLLVNPAASDSDNNDEGDFSFSSERRSTASRDGKSSTDSVWDRLSLSYTLPDPLVAIVPQSSMKVYAKLFHFLFAVRRIEMLLNLTWRQSSFLQHEIHTCAQRCAIHISEHETYAQANVLLRQIAMTRQAMMHFCLNLNSYLMYEVLETEWKRLVRSFEAASTLDELIAAHDNYLSGVYRKSLLSTQDQVDGEDLGVQIHELLRLSNAFCAYQEQVFGEALEAVQRAADKRKQAEKQQSSGEWGFKSEIEEEETFFGLSDTSKLHDLEYLSSVFNAQIVRFLRALDRRLNGGRIEPADEESTVARYGRQLGTNAEDLDSLRFLEFQLNHNGYYTSALNESRDYSISHS